MALSDEDHRTLSKGAGGRQTPVRLAQRARIALLATDGTMNKGIAVEVGTDRRTVARWREQFAQLGPAGLEKEAPRGGRPATQRSRVARKTVKATFATAPPKAMHWSTRTLAEHLGVSRSMVHRVWQANQLKPHLVSTF